MSISSQQFLNGLFYITISSFIIKYLVLMVYDSSLTDTDKETIKAGKGELSLKITILTLVYIIADISLYLNSAILFAVFIKEFLL